MDNLIFVAILYTAILLIYFGWNIYCDYKKIQATRHAKELKDKLRKRY